jgi:hypothetical protein
MTLYYCVVDGQYKAWRPGEMEAVYPSLDALIAYAEKNGYRLECW